MKPMKAIGSLEMEKVSALVIGERANRNNQSEFYSDANETDYLAFRTDQGEDLQWVDFQVGLHLQQVESLLSWIPPIQMMLTRMMMA